MFRRRRFMIRRPIRILRRPMIIRRGWGCGLLALPLLIGSLGVSLWMISGRL